jgi:hypothetical protein
MSESKEEDDYDQDSDKRGEESEELTKRVLQTKHQTTTNQIFQEFKNVHYYMLQ